jgi:hypothetical protein
MKNKIRELELKLQASKELFDKKEVNLKRKLAAEKAAKARMKNKIRELEVKLHASKELLDKKEVELNRLREEIESKNKQLAAKEKELKNPQQNNQPDRE